MARSSRTRRGKRSAEFQAPAVTSRPRDRRREARPAVEPAAQPSAPRGRVGGFLNFVGESWGELKKVDWPGQRQLVSATVAVIVAIAVVGVYLWGADAVLSRLVRDVLLNV